MNILTFEGLLISVILDLSNFTAMAAASGNDRELASIHYFHRVYYEHKPSSLCNFSHKICCKQSNESSMHSCTLLFKFRESSLLFRSVLL